MCFGRNAKSDKIVPPLGLYRARSRAHWEPDPPNHLPKGRRQSQAEPVTKGSTLPSRLPVNTSYAIGVAFAYSMVSICVRLAYDAGSNVLTVIAARALFVLLALWGYLLWRGTPWRLPAKERYISLALGLLLAASNFLLNQAIAHLPVANALLIF